MTQLLLTESAHISEGWLVEARASQHSSVLSVCHLPAVWPWHSLMGTAESKRESEQLHKFSCCFKLVLFPHLLHTTARNKSHG